MPVKQKQVRKLACKSKIRRKNGTDSQEEVGEAKQMLVAGQSYKAVPITMPFLSVSKELNIKVDQKKLEVTSGGYTENEGLHLVLDFLGFQETTNQYFMGCLGGSFIYRVWIYQRCNPSIPWKLLWGFNDCGKLGRDASYKPLKLGKSWESSLGYP